MCKRLEEASRVLIQLYRIHMFMLSDSFVYSHVRSSSNQLFHVSVLHQQFIITRCTQQPERQYESQEDASKECGQPIVREWTRGASDHKREIKRP